MMGKLVILVQVMHILQRQCDQIGATDVMQNAK
jgi:hypothetical protein